MNVRFHLNGDPVSVDVGADVPLIDVVRSLGRLGAKDACGVGVCGLCTVIVNSLPVSSCIYLAACAEATEVWTVEGLVDRDPALVDCFMRHEGLQCGVCTPGQVAAAWALRESGRDPSRESVTDFMAGNLCRCTGYQSVIDAVKEYRERP